MSTVRGALYRLRTKWPDLDKSKSPLLQIVDRSRHDAKPLRPSSKNQHLIDSSSDTDSINGHHSKVTNAALLADSSFMRIKNDEPLGCAISDWKQVGFVLSNHTCDLRYHLDASHSKTLDSQSDEQTASLGFVQEHTQVSHGPLIETVDRNLKTTEKLRLYTMEIRFQCKESLHSRFCVLGHTDKQEVDRWLVAIQLIIDRKTELHEGWQNYCSNNTVGDSELTEQWIKLRSGTGGAQMNLKARRRARLQNGKVLQDVPIIFDKFSEECSDWPIELPEEGEYRQGNVTKVMDLSRLVDALAELGLELSTKVSKRMLEEVQKNPPCPDIPDKIDLKRFMVIFQTCRQEMMVSPSAEMKQNLMRIMQDSKNPFLSLLSPMEQIYLIEGKNAEGHNVCTCKSYSKGTVLVKQNDEGDSMFLIIEGMLSVVVTFGSGVSAMQKEVAVLPSGAVMGEMSLVLGKPRSATCVVKSETASVAEIAKSAMIKLLDSRPSLARELEDIVYRRDASNYLTAGKAGHSALHIAEAMAAYRKRADQRNPAPGGAAPAAAAGGAAAAAGGGGGQGGMLPMVRPTQRIASRTTKAKHPPRFSPGPGGFAARLDGPPPRIKSGRWVKCKGVYVFLVD